MKSGLLRILSVTFILGVLISSQLIPVGASTQAVGLAVSPLNGDTTNPWPLILLAVAAAAVMIVMLVTRKKK